MADTPKSLKSDLDAGRINKDEYDRRVKALPDSAQRAEAAKPKPGVAADDPRAVPYREDFDARAGDDAKAEDERIVAAQAAADRHKEAVDVVDAAHENLAAAQVAFDAAVARRDQCALDCAKLGDPTPRPLTAAETLRPGEATVLMLFPRDVTLKLRDSKVATFPAGINPVPDSLKDHWWLLSHDVRPYDGPAAKATAKK